MITYLVLKMNVLAKVTYKFNGTSINFQNYKENFTELENILILIRQCKDHG